jgi:hypothetical protein
VVDGKFEGAPLLLLTTTGARSGLLRNAGEGAARPGDHGRERIKQNIEVERDLPKGTWGTTPHGPDGQLMFGAAQSYLVLLFMLTFRASSGVRSLRSPG